MIKVFKKSEYNDMIETLREAQEEFREVINKLESIQRMTNDGHAKAYLIDHLKIMESSNHDFCSRDFNIDKWIEQLEEEKETEAEENLEKECPKCKELESECTCVEVE